MKLKDKVVMLTGACGCIGRATAARFAQEGARLILCDVAEAPLNALAEKLRGAGCPLIVRAFDVRDYGAAKAAVDAGLETFGRIDVQINIAGGSAALVGKLSTFADSEPDTWKYVMDLNVMGSLNCAHAVLPDMIARRKGKIIFFGSIAGVNGLAGRADYSAAKGALASFTKALAMEVGQYNINVNCIAPGAIHRGAEPAKRMTYMGPEGLSSGPEPVAEMCLFLASEDSDFITGQTYQVDGGRTLGSRA